MVLTGFIHPPWANTTRNARQTSKAPFQCGWAEGSWGSWEELSQRLYTSLWSRTKVLCLGSQRPQENTLLLTDAQWVKRAPWGAVPAEARAQVEHFGHHSSFSSKVKWGPWLLVQAGMSSSKKEFGAHSWAGSMGDDTNSPGRTAPHLIGINWHVAKTCRARQPFIMGKHPKNLPGLSALWASTVLNFSKFLPGGELPHFI